MSVLGDRSTHYKVCIKKTDYDEQYGPAEQRGGRRRGERGRRGNRETGRERRRGLAYQLTRTLWNRHKVGTMGRRKRQSESGEKKL